MAGSKDDVIWEEPMEPEHRSDDNESEYSKAEDRCEEKSHVLT